MQSLWAAKKRDSYTALALVDVKSTSTDLRSIYRVYHADVEHSSDWKPLSILKAFLSRYGFSTSYRNREYATFHENLEIQFPIEITSPEFIEQYMHSIRVFERSVVAATYVENFYAGSPRPDNPSILDLEFTFTLNGSEYSNTLRGHGIRVSKSISPTSWRDAK